MLASALGRQLIRLQCYEGLDIAVRGLRVELPAADDRDPARRGRAGGHRAASELGARYLHRRASCIERPLLQALEPDADGVAAGAADRRARPHRRAVRGVPARGAVRFPGDDPRARHDHGGGAADRRHHVEPHARDPRRGQAPLPVSLGRLSGCDARARDPARARRRTRRRRLRARSSRSCSSCARSSCSSCPASPRRSTGRARSSRSTRWRSIRRRSTTRSACCSSTRTTSRDSAGRREAAADPQRRPRAHRAAGEPERAASAAELHARPARRERAALRARAARAPACRSARPRCSTRSHAVEAVGVERPRRLRYATLPCIFVKRREHLRRSSTRRSTSSGAIRGCCEKMLAALLPQPHGPAPPPPRDGRRARARRCCRSSAASRAPTSAQEVELDATLTFSAREVLQQQDFATMSGRRARAQRRRCSRSCELPIRSVVTRRTGRDRARPRGRPARDTLRSSMRLGGDVALPQLSQPHRAHSRRWSCCATSPGRWIATRACSCTSCTRSRNDRDRVHVLALRHAAHQHHAAAASIATSTSPSTSVASAVNDWAGGTRIGASLHEFNQHWSRRLLGQNAVVLLISDGLDATTPPSSRVRDGAAAQVVPRADLAQSAAALRRLRGAGPRAFARCCRTSIASCRCTTSSRCTIWPKRVGGPQLRREAARAAR